MTAKFVNSLTRKIRRLFAAPDASVETKAEPSGARGNRRLLFVFQGRQGYRVGMGRGLYDAEPVFRETVRRCSATVKERMGIKLIDAFESDAAARQVQQSEFHSILTHTVIHLGLSELWLSKGVVPEATIGLSLGELTSPYISGALSLEEVMTVARTAAQWDERVLARGKILVIRAGLETTEELCRESPVKLERFAEYGFSANEIFCASEDTERVTSFLTERGVEHRVYGGDYAYHTERFTACKEIIGRELESLQPRLTRQAFYSSLAGRLAPPGAYFDADYWYWMLAKPVLFNTAFTAALEDGYDTILHIGPHPHLTPHLNEAASKLKKEILIFDSLRDDEPETETFNRTYQALKDLNLVKTPQTRADSARETVFIRSEPDVTAQNIDLQSPEFLQNPYPFYEALRKKGSVHFLERHGFWLVLSYDAVASALKQPHLFSSQPARGLDGVLLGAEPAAHARARQFLAPRFSAKSANELSGFIESAVENLLDAASRKAEFDVVGELAIPLTEIVIARLLGLDDENLAALRRVVGTNKYQLNYYHLLEKFFTDYIGRIDEKPDDLFCKKLISGGDGNGSVARFTREEAASLMKLFWVAGTTTTSMLISTSVFLLLHHLPIRYEIQNDFDLLPQFIEESLRFDAPEQTAWRTTVEETEIAGVKIPKNAAVRLCLAAANRDPKHYENPASLILRRNAKDHLAFGVGHHYCLGANLARLEANIALRAILGKFPEFRPVQKINEVRYTGSSHFRALEKLIVATGG